MAEMKDIGKLAVDNYRGNVQKYSAGEANEVLRQALIEANGGSTKLDYKAIRDGKCNGLFALVEEILEATVVEGIQNDDFFNDFVDFRNVALGDSPVFETEDSDLYVVAEAADGTQGIRRQRLAGVNEVRVPTTFKAVRIYDELNRVLSGRVDFNKMINKVAQSFEKKILDDIYALWSNVTSTQLGGATYYVSSGSYSESDLLDMVAHVEAAAGGKTATLIGTKKALRTIAPSVQGIDSQNDLYHMGYYGSFYGSPVVAVPNRHKIGTTTFVLPDDVITIVAGDVKPIKFVYEGEPLMIMGDPTQNADLTQEYFFGQKYGVGIVLDGGQNTGIGHYEF